MKLDFAYPVEIRFDCTGCGLCCGDTPQKTRHVLLLLREVEKITKETGLSASHFSVETDNDPYSFEMKKTGGKCLFLKDNRCSIYSLRPLICQFYPFQLKYDLTLEKHVFDFTLECPAINIGRLFSRKEFERLFKLALQMLS